MCGDAGPTHHIGPGIRVEFRQGTSMDPRGFTQVNPVGCQRTDQGSAPLGLPRFFFLRFWISDSAREIFLKLSLEPRILPPRMGICRRMGVTGEHKKGVEMR